MTFVTPSKVASLIYGLAERDPSIQIRLEQIELAEKIEVFFDRSRPAQKIMVVEAPTGTGKTIAYLAGAVVGQRAATTRAYQTPTTSRLIISTSTNGLGDRLLEKDLALFDFRRPAPLRGINNFYCKVTAEEDDSAPWLSKKDRKDRLLVEGRVASRIHDVR
jgi:Rad3-related DNA helicase